MVKGHRPETPPRPRDPVVLVERPETDPCGSTRAVGFRLEAPAEAGAAVHLVPMGDELWVVAGTSRIGKVAAADDPAIGDCVARGWAFAGVVEDAGEGAATAVVRGLRTR